MNKYIYALNCPADKIREHIESLITIQKKFKEQGKDVPEEYKMPDMIEISPQNMEFLVKSTYVDFWGAGKSGNELSFYWKKTGNIPALEVRTVRLENGGFYLSYIKEEATKEKPSFEWTCKELNLDAEKHLIVSRDKINDDLEDKYGNKYSIDADALEYVCDMDYSPKKR